MWRRAGRITHGCLGLYSDANEAALERIVAFCHKHGFCKIGIQLSHSGRKGSATLPLGGTRRAAQAGRWRLANGRVLGIAFCGRMAGACAARRGGLENGYLRPCGCGRPC